MFLEMNSFPQVTLSENCEIRGTDNIQGQISEHIFTLNESYCIYIILPIFFSTRSFENWGISLRYSSVLTGAKKKYDLDHNLLLGHIQSRK